MLKRKAMTTAVAILIMFSHSGRAASQTSEVIGTMIARTPHTTLAFISLGEYPILQQLIVRVERDGDGFSKGQYLLLFFNNSSDRKAKLPKSMFKRSGLWEFTLTKRDESCDVSLKDLVNVIGADGSSNHPFDMTFVSWVEKEELPSDGPVRCYEFKPGGVRKQ